MKEHSMDLNQLLYHHQVALIRCAAHEADSPARGTRFDLVRHYEARIARLRRDLGVAGYPQWI